MAAPLSVIKSIVTVGGWTMVSRVLGFIRDLLIANFLGAGLIADAFFVAFKLPNLFRSLFAEGAFDMAVNLAGQAGVRYSLENPFSYVQSNVLGLVNLLECCRRHPVRHLLYASSSFLSTSSLLSSGCGNISSGTFLLVVWI